MGAFTAKVIRLEGNPKKPESAQHIIIFPGGSIEVSRTTNDEYWVHVEVHKGPAGSGGLREEKVGRVVDSRVDYDYPRTQIDHLPHESDITHMAVRITTK